MTDYGYCSVEDVDRVAQSQMSEKVGVENITRAIKAQTEWVEFNTRRHWFDPNPDNDEHGVIATEPKNRDDEHDLQGKAGSVIEPDPAERRRGRFGRRQSDTILERPHGRRRPRQHRKLRIAMGDRYNSDVPTYTSVRPERKDVTEVNELHIANEDGEYIDWVDDPALTVEVGSGLPDGQDAWIRINNRGVPELYINVHTLDEQGMPRRFANAVYVDIEYGTDELTEAVRTAVAMLTLVHLSIDDEASVGIPDNGQLMNVETKSEAYERIAREYGLEGHLESSW